MDSEEAWDLSVVMAVYEGATIQVRVDSGLSEKFSVNAGVHQGATLRPFLFILEALSSDLRIGLPLEVLYVNILVLVAESEVEAVEKLRRCREGMESKHLRINIVKTKLMHAWADGGMMVTMEGVWPCTTARRV